MGPAVEPGGEKAAAGAEVPVLALSRKTAGKTHPQVSPAPPPTGTARRFSP